MNFITKFKIYSSSDSRIPIKLYTCWEKIEGVILKRVSHHSIKICKLDLFVFDNYEQTNFKNPS